jgi:hypothetical protein
VGQDYGREEVLEELDALRGGGDLLRRVSILRAADVYWSLQQEEQGRRPTLFSILGDEQQQGDTEGPRIMVKPFGR